MTRFFSQQQSPAVPPEICGGSAGRLRRLVLRVGGGAFLLFLVAPLPARVYLLRPAAWFALRPTRDCQAQFRTLQGAAPTPPAAARPRHRFPRTRAAAERRFTELFFLGLSASELADRDPLLRRPAADLLCGALTELLRPEFYRRLVGRWGDPFDESRTLRGNVYYLGRVNLLFGRYGRLTKDGQFDTLFHRFSIALQRNFADSPTHTVESVPGGCIVPDQVIALASLSVHDALWGTHYSDVAKQWVAFMRTHLEPKTELLPTVLDASTGKELAPPTGAALAQLLPFLFDLDPVFAQEQYDRWVKRFFVPCGGAGWFRNRLPGTRWERNRPEGRRIRGDVRGNVFLATTFALGAAKAAGDPYVFGAVLELIESLGFPVSTFVRKDYWLLPHTGDVLVLWGKAVHSTARAGHPVPGARWWRSCWLPTYLGMVVVCISWVTAAIRRAGMALTVCSLIRQGRVGSAEEAVTGVRAGRWSPLHRRTRERLAAFAALPLLRQTPVRDEWLTKSDLLGRLLGTVAALALLVSWGVLNALTARHLWYSVAFVLTCAALSFAEWQLENLLWQRLEEKHSSFYAG